MALDYFCCKSKGRGRRKSCLSLRPATCPDVVQDVRTGRRAVASPGLHPPHCRSPCVLLAAPTPKHPAPGRPPPGLAAAAPRARGRPNQSAGGWGGLLGPLASSFPGRALALLSAPKLPPNPGGAARSQQRSRAPGSPREARRQEWLLGIEGARVRAALREAAQAEAERRGRAGTKCGRQNFGWKAGVEETRRGGPNRSASRARPGAGAGDPPGGTSGARPGRLPSPSPDWQAACDGPRAPQRPGRPGERDRPPAGVGGGARLYIAALSRPAQRAGRRAPLRRVPARAARPAPPPAPPCSPGSCLRPGAPSLASRSSAGRALPARARPCAPAGRHRRSSAPRRPGRTRRD